MSSNSINTQQMIAQGMAGIMAITTLELTSLAMQAMLQALAAQNIALKEIVEHKKAASGQPEQPSRSGRRQPIPTRDTATGIVYRSKASAAIALAHEYGLKAHPFSWYEIRSRDPERLVDADVSEITYPQPVLPPIEYDESIYRPHGTDEEQKKRVLRAPRKPRPKRFQQPGPTKPEKYSAAGPRSLSQGIAYASEEELDFVVPGEEAEYLSGEKLG